MTGIKLDVCANVTGVTPSKIIQNRLSTLNIYCHWFNFELLCLLQLWDLKTTSCSITDLKTCTWKGSMRIFKNMPATEPEQTPSRVCLLRLKLVLIQHWNSWKSLWPLSNSIWRFTSALISVFLLWIQGVGLDGTDIPTHIWENSSSLSLESSYVL